MQKKVLLIVAVLNCHCPIIAGEDSIPTAEQTLQRLQLSEGLKAELVAKALYSLVNSSTKAFPAFPSGRLKNWVSNALFLNRLHLMTV